MRSQDRGKDERGSAMSLCKQRLLFVSRRGGLELPPVQRKHPNPLSVLAQKGSGSSGLEASCREGYSSHSQKSRSGFNHLAREVRDSINC